MSGLKGKFDLDFDDSVRGYQTRQLMQLGDEHEIMRRAMQEFCDRVEQGQVRSTKTYSKFKLILKSLKGFKV